MGFFKYDLTKLIGSGARTIFAPSTYVVPVASGVPSIDMNDLISPLSSADYAAVSPWDEFGAAREGQAASYERNVETEDWAIEQATGAVATDVTDVPRTMTVQMAEIAAEGIAILENAPASRAVSAASGQSAQTAVDFGSFENIDRYRIAMLGQRRKGMGADVTEPGGTVRGAFVACVLFSVSISSNATSYELQKGQLANVSLEFESFPETTITDSRRDRGTWIFETAGTIAA